MIDIKDLKDEISLNKINIFLYIDFFNYLLYNIYIKKGIDNMLEFLAIFVLIIFVLFLICSFILLKDLRDGEDIDFEFSIGNKKIIEYHKNTNEKEDD